MVFGIGNPLIDVVIQARNEDLQALGLEKGIMHLVDLQRQEEILAHFGSRPRTYRPGGSAPNTMLALAGLGLPAVICGKIGNDEFGRTYAQQVAAYGITSRLSVGDGPTGSSVILVTPDGERTMNTHLGMCQTYSVADIDRELLLKADILYFTGYMWDTDSQKNALREAIRIAKEAGIRVAFDLADPFAVQRYAADFRALLAGDIDILFANRREAGLLFPHGPIGETDTANAAGAQSTPSVEPAASGATGDEGAIAALQDTVPLTAYKVGKEGSIVIEGRRAKPGGPATREGSRVQVPGRPIVATDSTGAGDMYAAGFLAGLQSGRSPAQAAAIAGHLAEEIIQHIGAQFSVEEIRALRAVITRP